MDVGRYKITFDTHNVTVNERYDKKDKDGNFAGAGLRFIGYHGTLEKALVSLVDVEPKVDKSGDVESLLETMQQLKSDIAELVKGVKPLEEVK